MKQHCEMANINCPKCKGYIDKQYDIGLSEGKVCKWCWEKWLAKNDRYDEIEKRKSYIPMEDKLFDNVRIRK